MDTQTLLAPCPPWCRHAASDPNHRDGEAVFHTSPPVNVTAFAGDGLIDLTVCRIDDDEEPTGEATVAVNVGRGLGQDADMTPAQAVVFAEQVRAHALTAAGADGVDMPVELVRLGEQILVGGRWETVETLFADGWCCGRPVNPGHRPLVQVCTGVHDDDNDGHQFAAGDVVRVRTAVAA